MMCCLWTAREWMTLSTRRVGQRCSPPSPTSGGRREGRKGRLPRGCRSSPLRLSEARWRRRAREERGALPAGTAGEERGAPVGSAGRYRSDPGTGHPRAALRCPAAPAAGRECPRARAWCFYSPFRCAWARSGPPRPPGTSSKWKRRCRRRCRPGPQHPPSCARHRQPEGYFGKQRFTPLGLNPPIVSTLLQRDSQLSPFPLSV